MSKNRSNVEKLRNVTSEFKTINNQNILGSGNINTLMDLSGKQDNLVSGTNIKTVNNQNILGSGNIDIGGSDISGSLTLGTILTNSGGTCAIGTLAESNANHAIAIGYGTKVNGSLSIAIGESIVSDGTFSVILGDYNTSTAGGCYIIGRQNTTSGSGILFGSQNTITGNVTNKILGSNNNITESSGNIIVHDILTLNQVNSTIIIGTSSTVGTQANYSTVLGYSNSISAYCYNSLALGYGNGVDGQSGISIGNGNSANGNLSIVIGVGNMSQSYESIALGQSNYNYKLRTLALGRNVTLGSASNYKIAIGNGANQSYTDADNNIAIGVLEDDTTVLKGLKIEANAGANKVLTSDANGVASWQALSSGAAIYIQETEPIVAVGQKALWIQKMPDGTFDFKIIEN